MNKSIRQFAESAGGMKFPNSFSGSLMDVNAFATALLKECINGIEEARVDEYTSDDWDIGYDVGLAQAIAVIKERFGPLE